MCLILIALNEHPDYPLILAANRDEYFRRPTREAAYWEDAPGVLGGRDLEANGSWLGMDRRGRIAAVTNVREPPLKRTGLESRGRLVADYLKNRIDPESYLQDVIRRRLHFDAYNLLVGIKTDLFFHTSRGDDYEKLDSGIHGISNGELNCDWPKVVGGKKALLNVLNAGPMIEPDDLFAILADTTAADDTELPDTGIGTELERNLSPIFIHMDGYGTRSSTVLTMDSNGDVVFCERNFSAVGTAIDTLRFEFTLESG
ncbi:MAG: NRDE family protein [Gammaproteobacteria bacterium]